MRISLECTANRVKSFAAGDVEYGGEAKPIAGEERGVRRRGLGPADRLLFGVGQFVAGSRFMPTSSKLNTFYFHIKAPGSYPLPKKFARSLLCSQP